MTFKHVPQVGRVAQATLTDARPLVPQPAPMPLTPPAFTYDDLAPETADLARHAVGEIRRLQKAAIIDIGRILIQVKAALDHGTFGAWLEAEFAMGARSAENYMAAAKFLEGKSETVAYLPPAALYALAAPSADEKVVSAVLDEVESGKVLSANEVRDRLNAASRDRKAAELAASKSPEEIRKAKEAKCRAEAARKAREENWKREDAERAAERHHHAQTVAKFLVEKLNGDDIATLVKLTKQVDFSQVRNFFLPRDLWGAGARAADGESVLKHFREKMAEGGR